MPRKRVKVQKGYVVFVGGEIKAFRTSKKRALAFIEAQGLKKKRKK